MAKNDAAAREDKRLLMVSEAATASMIIIQCRYQAMDRVATLYVEVLFDRVLCSSAFHYYWIWMIVTVVGKLEAPDRGLTKSMSVQYGCCTVFKIFFVYLGFFPS
jgi:hypothetical protein